MLQSGDKVGKRPEIPPGGEKHGNAGLDATQPGLRKPRNRVALFAGNPLCHACTLAWLSTRYP